MAQGDYISAWKPGPQSSNLPFLFNYCHQQHKTRLLKYSACQFVFIYVRSSACGWRYKYAPKLMQTFYQASNSSDVLAHLPVVSKSHFLNIPCPIQGGNIVFGTSQGETQMFGSWLLKFLELPWTKGERPEVVQHYLFCLVSYQLFKTTQQIKCGHFLSARPMGATSTV